MQVFRLYIRTLGLLGSEVRLAIILSLANLLLAVAAFAEPILFGWIIDALTGAQKTGKRITWAELTPWTAWWVGFGLFTIGASVLVALHADRLSHRRRLAIMSTFFEHVLHLPLSFHTSVH